jgi:Spy/CpxP family protein refolding chaperone
MSFFKSKFRRPLFGFCGSQKHGCGRGAMTPEQFAERRTKMADRMTNKLLLNAEQKPLLIQLMDALYVQRQAMVGSTLDPRAEFRSWFAGASFDAARAQALINEKTGALQANSPAVLAALGAFFDSLNPAQQQKLRNFMEGPRCWFRRAKA